MAFRFNQGDRPLSGYTLQRGVGRGGFGEVYYAVSDGGKEVALKYLRDNPTIELRGVQACLNLKSPHLVQVYDVKQNDAGDWFVVMEYVTGPSLRQLMDESPAGLGVQKAAYLLREIGKGLTYLHDRGIVHRDLKPGNVFYDEGYAKIGDYGLSKFMAASQHSGQTVSVGTVHYMAPEIGSGNYDRTIDIYALGVMLYEMLLGRVPFAGATVGEILMKHLTAQPEVDELPAPFPEVIRKALAKDPKERFQTIPDMMRALFAGSALEHSLQGFEPASLSVAARRVEPALAAVGAGRRGIGSGSSTVPPLITPGPPPLLGDRAGSRFAAPPRSPAVPQTSEPPFPPRSRLFTGLLGVFLGPLGVHRFYLGYNGIGFWQIVATFFSGGLGGLWGIMEGVTILANGNMKDAFNRPLVDRDPRTRSGVLRGVFGLAAMFCLTAAFGLAVGGTFAFEPDIRWSLSDQPIQLNPFRFMYLAASACLGAGGFLMWKAAHRNGYSFWRATIRPAAICAGGAFALAGLATHYFIAQGNEQPFVLLAALFAALTMAVFWQLRGPEAPLIATDVYWDGALRKVFLLLTVLAGMATVTAVRESKTGSFRDRLSRTASNFAPLHDPDAIETADLRDTSLSSSRSRRSSRYRVSVDYVDALPAGSADPGALSPFTALLTASCLLEARYRRRRQKNARAAFVSNEFRIS